MSHPTSADGTTAEQRTTDAASLVRSLHAEGEIPTGTAGELLILLGGARHLAADPAEADRNLDDEQTDWDDATGRTWPLSIERGALRDNSGRGWHWAGGFQWAPDKQPLISSDDYRVTDVPLSHLLAVVGDLVHAGT